jgi:hypothetical protein
MRMLKLATDSLVVQSFDTAESSRAGGTVDEPQTVATTGGPYFCPAYCDDTSGPSCGQIGDTCGYPPTC